MNFTKFFNGELGRVPTHGGSIQVTISAANSVQANAGATLPCKKAWVAGSLSNVGYVRMNIGAAASGTLGVIIPQGPVTSFSVAISTGSAPTPLAVEIDDVSKLYFFGTTDSDAVDITYRE